MTRPRLTGMPHQIAQREAQARAKAGTRTEPFTHDCAACGLVGEGCFGFGGLPSAENALWACRDLECRAAVEAMAAGRDQLAAKMTTKPARVPDLFDGEAA